MQLQRDLDKIRATGTQVVGISYDSPDALKAFADMRGITFPLLADEGSHTIDAYGVRNKDVPKGSPQDGIPHPGTFLLDGQGIVRAKLFEQGYVKRHSNEALIKAAEAID